MDDAAVVWVHRFKAERTACLKNFCCCFLCAVYQVFFTFLAVAGNVNRDFFKAVVRAVSCKACKVGESLHSFAFAADKCAHVIAGNFDYIACFCFYRCQCVVAFVELADYAFKKFHSIFCLFGKVFHCYCFLGRLCFCFNFFSLWFCRFFLFWCRFFCFFLFLFRLRFLFFLRLFFLCLRSWFFLFFRFFKERFNIKIFFFFIYSYLCRFTFEEEEFLFRKLEHFVGNSVCGKAQFLCTQLYSFFNCSC